VGEAVLTSLTFAEIYRQYGQSTPHRQFLCGRLQTVIQLLSATGALRRLYLFGSFVTVKPTPRDLDCLAVMATGFTTATLSSPVLEVFQHDLCRLYYHTDMFWVTEAVGTDHIDAILQVFSRDRHGLPQPIVEVQV
jgi:hypothetical protein